MNAQEPIQRHSSELVGGEADRRPAAVAFDAGWSRPRLSTRGTQALTDSSPRQAAQSQKISSWRLASQALASSADSRRTVQRAIHIKSTRSGQTPYPVRTLDQLQKSLKYKNYVARAKEDSVAGLRARVLLQIVTSWTRLGEFKFESLAALWKAAEGEASANIDSDPDRQEKLETLKKADASRAAAKFERKSLHDARLPPSFPQSSGSAVKATPDGREDGAFSMTANTLDNAISASTSRVSLALHSEQRAIGNYEPDTSGGGSSICPTCAHPTRVVDFEVDHQQAFSAIRKELFEFSKAMETDRHLRERIEDEMDSFDEYFAFVKDGREKHLYPTKTAMSHYSNDLANLLAICHQCNSTANKGALALKAWYLDNEFYGPAFIDKYWDDSETGVLDRTRDGGGWGDAAREWFQKHHLSILKKMFPSVKAAQTLHDRIRDEATLSMEANSSSPSTKEKKGRQLWHLSGSNQAASSTITTAVDALAPEKIAPLGADSPLKLTSNLRTGISNVVADREAGKRGELNVERSTRFAEGLANGRRGSSRLYTEGNFEEYDKGYAEGTTERIQLVSMPSYQVGLQDGKAKKKRAHDKQSSAEALAYQLGYVDGLDGH